MVQATLSVVLYYVNPPEFNINQPKRGLKRITKCSGPWPFKITLYAQLEAIEMDLLLGYICSASLR